MLKSLMNFLLILSLLFSTACSSLYLKAFNTREKIKLKKTPTQITLSGKNIKPLVLEKVEESYVWQKESWSIPTKKGLKEVYLILLTKPETSRGRKMLVRGEFKSWVTEDKCLLQKNNHYFVQVILSDMSQIALGCIREE